MQGYEEDKYVNIKIETRSMPINVSNTTESFAATLKDVQRLEAPEARRKEKDTPAEAVAKAVTVSVSTDVKMQILKDTLE